MADKNWQTYNYHPPLKDDYKLGFKFGQKYPAGFGNLTGQKHLGQDYIMPKGNPIYAIAGGRTKSSVGIQGGKTVTLTTNNALSVRYMHLDRFIGASNGLVNKGDIIGYTGNTGVSTVPHLHLDVYNGLETKPSNFYGFIDPLSLNYQIKEEDMETKEIRAIVEGIYWSFAMRQPDKGGVDFWVEEYKREGEKSKWLARILEGLRGEKIAQKPDALRYLDAKENRWRSEKDIQGK
jgi:murein DD-endopeptidase MepM/ murein hydrolase activator NlpD